MGVDTLDISILLAVLAALIAYFARGSLSGGSAKELSSLNLSSDSRDLVEVVSVNKKKFVVFYGSQTGTAEDYANKFAKELQSRFHVPTVCCDLADFDYDNFSQIADQVEDFKGCAFFMATYGEGEPTDNSVDFFEYLNNDCESLQGIKFTCFGLGNSTYEFYNASGKNLNQKFLDLGAESIAPYGEGDDGAATMDEDYLAWKEAAFDTMKSHLSLQEHDVKYEPLLQIIPLPETSIDEPTVALGEPTAEYINPKSELQLKKLKLGPFDHAHPYLAPVALSRELFNSDSRHCIHAEFDLSESNLKYSTGDHLAIWPSNSDQNVQTFFKAFGITDIKDDVFNLTKLDPTTHIPFPLPTTYEAVVRHHLEISGPVSRQFLQSIHQFAPNQASKDKVAELAGSSEVFHKEITAKYFNIADALLYISNGEPWSDVPFNFVIEFIQHLQPRYYSISSSSLSEKQTVHVTAVVENETPKGADHAVTGVATNLLWNIQLQQGKSQYKPNVTYDLLGPRNSFQSFKLPVHIRRSTFKLPTNPATPIIMIGPGTGVAPFRGFIRERVKQAENGVANLGKSFLFFGSRSQDEDFLYKEEWIDYSKKLGDNFQLITAFSRDQLEKIYVQHRMKEYSKEINEVLANGGFFYICGDASKMARDVNAALVEIISTERNMSEDAAAEVVKGLKTSNRYQEDVW